MRILHTESMGVRGGEPKRVIDELLIIRELGWEPYLLCRPETWLESEALRHKIPVLHAPIKRAFDPKSVTIMLREFRRLHIDIVHSHNSKDSYSAFIASKSLGIPFIRARHNDLVKRPGPIYSLSDKIVTTGEKIRQELIAYGYTPEKIVSIPSYPDAAKFRPVPMRRVELRQEWQAGNALILGTMTGFNPRKRPHWILPMLPALIRDFPNLIYLIAGPDVKPDFRQSFEKELRDLNLQKHVRFVGYQEPAAFLDAIDLYLCPSSREGVPQALMQAMMMGKACISTNVGGIFELNPQDNLPLFAPNDREGFANELRSLLADPDRRQRLGTLNRTLSVNHFSRNVMRERMRSLYTELGS